MKTESPWYTDEIRIAKRERRKAERKWRSSGKLEVHKQIYREHCKIVSKLCKQAKQDYYCLKIEESGKDQFKVFSIANDLLNRNKEITLPSISNNSILSETFADFFTDKIKKIRETFTSKNDEENLILDNYNEDELANEIIELDLPMFTLTTENELRKIIMGGNSKYCHLDPIPTQLLKSCIDVLLPVLVRIVNSSLSDSCVPTLNIKGSIYCSKLAFEPLTPTQLGQKYA